jgi:hypothetical protein
VRIRAEIVRRAGLAGVLVALAVGAPACGGSGDGAIDVRALERQLSRVIRLQLTAGSFFERDVHVACVEVSVEGPTFRCRIDATNPHEQTQSWDLTVSCRDPRADDAPRCFSERGDALQ